MKILTISMIGFLGLASVSFAKSHKEAFAADSPEREAALKVQLFLDKKGFGPGRIDGKWGEFTQKAVTRWNEAGQDPKIVLDDGGDLKMEKLPSGLWSDDLKQKYEVSEGDQKLVGSLPSGPAEKAAQASLPYTSLLEVIAERFHAYPSFLKELNEGKDLDALKVGSEIWVPNVSSPFDLSEVKGMAGSEAAEDTGHQVMVYRGKEVVEVHKDGDLVHSFPITVGAQGNRTPAGDWKVEVVQWMPEFRYDKEMLENGTRSSNSHMLPPGPNNPVGIAWIGISSDGIGLHGTAHPDTIGRSESHGCIRLSNWDAKKLGSLVTVGTPVIVQ